MLPCSIICNPIGSLLNFYRKLHIFNFNQSLTEETRHRGNTKFSFSFLFKQEYMKLAVANKLEFSVHLCDDTLLELLRFGMRCQLATIESIGRRFHRIIESNLRKAPFLLLKMSLTLGYNYSQFLITHM